MLEKTIVSREESNAIKGLLILLIALGHNSILSFTWNGCEAVGAYFHRNWLYQFHVYVFFMLPFIYNEQPYRKGNLRKYAIRMLWPYIWICLICLAMSLCVLGNPFNGWANLTWTLISGNITLLGLNIGSQFPWFLMTMFALMLLKDLYYSLAHSLTHSLFARRNRCWFVGSCLGDEGNIAGKIRKSFQHSRRFVVAPGVSVGACVV